MVIFLKTASGASCGPYVTGDAVDLSPGTITKLGDAVQAHPDPNASPSKRADAY